MEKTTKKTTKKAAKKVSAVKKVASPKKTVAVAKKTLKKAAPAEKVVKVVKEEVAKDVQKEAVTPKVEAKTVAPKPEVKAVAKTVAKAPVKAKRSMSSASISHGVGRRKSAVARVWLQSGNGSIKVNERDFTDYFDTQKTRLRASEPFNIVRDARHYDVVVNVQGGGTPSQADAVCLGVARALLKINESWRSALRGAGLLTVDARVKERKKYGQKAARRKFQFVKR